MKVYIYSPHYSPHYLPHSKYECAKCNSTTRTFFTLFYVLFLSFIHGFLPAHGRKTDYIINMALAWWTYHFFRCLELHTGIVIYIH